MQRRQFLKAAGLGVTVSAAGSTAALAASPHPRPRFADDFDARDWRSLRDQFPLDRSMIHMATFLLASHPKPVAAAIEHHRRGLDGNPADYWHERFRTIDDEVRGAVAQYTGGHADHIALTDSTTMGLGLVYQSVRLAPGDEVLVGAHGHYSTLMSWEHRQSRERVNVRHVDFYADPAQASVDEILSNLRRAVTDRTRVLAITWVHSSTGVKMPVAAMAAVLREINASREPHDRVLFCVDGVHGFGNQQERVEDLGCDVFIAGTHKWIFGPRGTGIIWARPEAWPRLAPMIPSFGPNAGRWMGALPPDAPVAPGSLMTPGGFHSFEHRWALPEGFALHQALGADRVHARIVELNTRCKQGLAEIRGVRVHTPMAPELSAAIIAFEIEGVAPDEYVDRMHARGVIGSSSPYRRSYPRLAPSLLNDEDEVDRSVREVARLG